MTGTSRKPLMCEIHSEWTPVEIAAVEKVVAEVWSALEEVEGAASSLGDYPYWESDVPLAADLALQNLALQVTFVHDALKAIQGREVLNEGGSLLTAVEELIGATRDAVRQIEDASENLLEEPYA